ncbi:LuxR family transcriptional regulator [Streptomyces sp. ST2-7A]|uniref:helix-turn-helix transcriptional regulator n=1 Tax=Streptomyces sp. ST2-7A TaxID=2907214 RepID=UPI001F4912FF|nr:LuxR family transcriptional regulator [Streptomyces sp. ST2-7A]MCE7079121.1 LuxR C-terminal-related transcriptional regulator [Streptomyces sp. ST2-7A]
MDSPSTSSFPSRSRTDTAVRALLDRARAGHGGALLVRAETGMGVSAVLERAASAFPVPPAGGRGRWLAHPPAARAPVGSRPAGPVAAGRLPAVVLAPPEPVVRLRGVRAETGMPLAGLHALAGRLAGPDAARELLETARPGGASPVAVPVIGDAVLLLLQERTRSAGPVLCCVDDVQWVDPVSREVLGFVARRLGAGVPVALVMGWSTIGPGTPSDVLLGGVPEETLPPLSGAEVEALLDRSLPEDADPAVREALAHEAAGNPGLLADLLERLSPARLTGAEPLPRPLSVDGPRLRRAEQGLRSLPDPTRDLLVLVAAAREVEGEAGIGAVLRAAALLSGPDGPDGGRTDPDDSPPGDDASHFAPAEAAGVLRRDGDRLRLVGPLVWRAVRRAVSPRELRDAHLALAEALRGAADQLPRLRHLAAAAEGPDPALAGRLAAEVEGAAAVRPPTDSADALLRAAELVTDPDNRGTLLTAAAEHTWAAGRPQAARTLLERARMLPAGDVTRGRAALVLGTLQRECGVITDARESLVQAARLLGPHDPDRAGDALRVAAEAAWVAGTGPLAMSVAGSTEDAQHAPRDDYGAGMAALLEGGLATAIVPLRRVLERARRSEQSADLLRAAVVAMLLGENNEAYVCASRGLAVARLRGERVLEPHALELLAYAELRCGRHGRAAAHAREGLRSALRTGQRNSAAHHHAALAMAAAIDGDPERCARHAADAEQDAGAHGLGIAATMAEWALARCDLALNRPRQAALRLGALLRNGPGRGHFALRTLALPCFIEATVLCGQPEHARPALKHVASWAAATADSQAVPQLLRCRALCAPPEAAPQAFARALEAHRGADNSFERSRTQLLHGMALRRGRRPRDAREVLRDALIGFEQCGAEAWAQRARGELRATGESDHPVGGPAPEVLATLTPQQLRVARHVAEGATNREVAVRLSVSPRTVDHHLRNVFSALGIRSRVELTRLLADAPDTPEPR